MNPYGNNKKNFADKQELAIKAIMHHAFGVLEQRFAIMCGLERVFKIKDLTNIMKACIILHSMIIKNNSDDHGVSKFEYDQLDKYLPQLSRNYNETYGLHSTS